MSGGSDKSNSDVVGVLGRGRSRGDSHGEVDSTAG